MFDVLRYEGPESAEVFAWRHPNRDLKVGTTVIVQFNQEALFVSNGRPAATLGEGKHKINGGNVPFLTAVSKQFSGGVSSHSAQVWFVNLNFDIPNIKWGTPTPIKVVDPSSGLRLTARVNGEFTARVVDSHLLVERLMGQREAITREDVQNLVRQATLATVNQHIAQALAGQEVDILDTTVAAPAISEGLRSFIADSTTRTKYGVEIDDFQVQHIVYDESEEAYQQVVERRSRLFEGRTVVEEKQLQAQGTIVDAQAQGQATVIGADADSAATVLGARAAATKRQLEGYTYQEERQFDVLDKAAANEGSGSEAMNLGMGLTMGLGAGRAVVRHARPGDGRGRAAAAAVAADGTDARGASGRRCEVLHRLWDEAADGRQVLLVVRPGAGGLSDAEPADGCHRPHPRRRHGAAHDPVGRPRRATPLGRAAGGRRRRGRVGRPLAAAAGRPWPR
ncbi:MAG: SPFH domain-containing protein [Aeromicrobium sp.]